MCIRDRAKEYLRQRLDAELSMRTNLQIVMIEAAKQIIDISYRYKICLLYTSYIWAININTKPGCGAEYF